MNISEWQKRLVENFSMNGIVGGNLLEIQNFENSYGEYYIKTFHGQNILIDSFQSFFKETLDSGFNWISKYDWPKNCPYYPLIFLYYIILFRSYRACENLLLKGYPLDGYALLRDLKDRVVFLAGIAHNITSFSLIHGYGGQYEVSQENYWAKIKPITKKEELRVLNRILRKESGLPEHLKLELKLWENLFHEEVHGSKFSFFQEIGNWIEHKNISIGPRPQESSMAMYMNRSAEIGWLIVKLLPYLQPTESAFGDNWGKKYKILDESFRYAIQGLSKAGKRIADAFIFLVDSKFHFPETFHYFEADGKG